jgi:hypothetical protein
MNCPAEGHDFVLVACQPTQAEGVGQGREFGFELLE